MLNFLSSCSDPVHILICMGKIYVRGAIKMEKYKTATPTAPQQDVDDLIFSGQTDAVVSQR